MYLAEADRAAKEAFKRDLNEAGITAKSLKRQERDERKLNEKEQWEKEQKEQNKDWHQAKDGEGNIYYWNSKTRETKWKPPALWEEMKKEEEEKQIELETTDNPNIIKVSKPSFKKSGRSLFNSGNVNGTNSKANSTTLGLKENSEFAKTLSWRGADDENRRKKRSNDVAYGTFVPIKPDEEIKEENFANPLGLPVCADAFHEQEAADPGIYKGFTYKDDKFQVGGEAKPELISDDAQANAAPVAFKKKKFGGNVRRKFD